MNPRRSSVALPPSQVGQQVAIGIDTEVFHPPAQGLTVGRVVPLHRRQPLHARSSSVA